MKTLLAVDPGTKTCSIAWFIDGTLAETITIKSDNQERWIRQYEIITALQGYLRRADQVVSENPMMQGIAAQSMHKFLGALEYARGNEVHWVHPMTVRKAIAGSGKADKLEMAIAAGAMLKTEAEQDILAQLVADEDFDATDAISIGLYWLGKQGEETNA